MKDGTKLSGKGNIQFCAVIHCDVNTFNNYTERLECFSSDGLEWYITLRDFLIYNQTDALDILNGEDGNNFPVQFLPIIHAYSEVAAEL